MTVESSSETMVPSAPAGTSGPAPDADDPPTSSQGVPAALRNAPAADDVPAPIEVVQTPDYYILVRGEHSLWWRRSDGSVTARSAWDLAAADDPVCLGVCQAFVGRVQASVGGEYHLLLVRESVPVGRLPDGHMVRKVTKVTLLPLSSSSLPDTPDTQLTACVKHTPGASVSTGGGGGGTAAAAGRGAGLARTWGLMKTVTTRAAAATAAAAQSAGAQVKERVPGRNRRPAAALSPVLEELLKLFNDSDSFFFSVGGDLTNSLARRLKGAEPDDRFFWNAPAAAAVLALPPPAADAWVQPIVQGYVHISECGDPDGVLPPHLRLSLISRRSRHRAGTRYRRRGVDPDGWVANYVETEQILSSGDHHLSFVQVRGSVPVFWAQPGYRYRPPPRLERDPVQTAAAFRRHVDAEVERYGAVHCVSLVDQTGREKVIADAYLDQALAYDSERLTFTAFDFHDHCRGLRFENVALLLAAVSDDLAATGFTWADRRGALCQQSAVFRVSCIDCLDRTNVVQTALARTMLQTQLSKLGVAGTGALPASLRNTFQQMWADTGDALSRQYAGTGALKGDFTRTGERRWTGLMRDGVNSANRYYLNRFRDAGRQAAIEASLGRPPVEPEPEDEADGDESDEAAAVERVRQLLDDSQRLLVPDGSVVMGTWGLIDADADATDGDQELDTILILTTDSYYAACYDDDTDRIVSYQRVPLCDLQSIELGPVEASRLSRSPRTPCLRLWYEISGESGYFHQLRATPLRFFNNVAVTAGSAEDQAETLRALAAALVGACEAAGHQVPLSEGRLARRKSRASLASSRRAGRTPLRWLDETPQPGSLLRTAGTRAASSVAAAAAWLPSRLRPLWSDSQQQSQTERNSPEEPSQESGDMLIDSAGIIACPVGGPTSPPAVGQPGENATEQTYPEVEVDGRKSTRHEDDADGQGSTQCAGNADQSRVTPEKTSSHQVNGPEQDLAKGNSSLESSQLPDVVTTATSSQLPRLASGESASSSREPTEIEPPSSISVESKSGTTGPSANTEVPSITVSSDRPSVGGLSLLGSALSPLTSPARDTVLVGFSRLARGVQRLGSAASTPSGPRKLEMSDVLRQRIAGSKTRVTML
ncbi:phosphatidylinositide phosphatase SAC2-like [Amphibalanus amphitrite]|uniref:phosphatidylinositide phosphatase SAC2-like n=1 Tax=Amphibalanus amphitrite TaxID=1232801 RepID=UPI001C9088BD|nr:phosphatidylinositide phosphatase SAC2-like [Amphibalanus amphitrite]XP_043212374.1 phosphatidylinositide phosphatase SAC2-like [Amphibalanus amphitrite]XP_043212375.1 phosphatidylinositide phosphatase SAC2-like [Amphibalanus amphitrite]